jgi:hypothetical protein
MNSLMETIIITLLGACGVALVAIAKWVAARFATSETKHAECEARNDALAERVHEVEKKVVFLDACGIPDCPARANLNRFNQAQPSFHITKNP